jgi:membrane AbrB-like protein
MQAAGVPAPYLLAGLVAGMTATLSGVVTTSLPRPVYRTSQALAGVLMGSHIDPVALCAVASALLPFAAVTAVTVVLSVCVAFLLSRSGVDRTTATLGMVPGGSSAMLAAADDLGADTRLVALAQYFRVGVIALTAPLIVPLLGSAVPRHLSGHDTLRLVNGANQPAGLMVLGAVALLGIRMGRRLSLPAPLVLGPMLAAALATLAGAAHGFAPAGILQNLVFTGIGLEIGQRFSRESLRHAGRVIAPLIAGALVICLACALLAWPLAGLTHLSLTDAYLATAPGGINAVLPAAVAAHSNVALISTVQSLRLFGVVLLAPPLIRWMSARTPSHRTTDPARVGCAGQPEARGPG